MAEILSISDKECLGILGVEIIQKRINYKIDMKKSCLVRNEPREDPQSIFERMVAELQKANRSFLSNANRKAGKEQEDHGAWTEESK